MFYDQINFHPVDENGSVRPEIVEIFRALGMPEASGLSLVEMTREALKLWVTKGKERWQETPVVTERHDEIVELFRLLGMYDEILPPAGLSYFDHVLVLGGTLAPQDRKNAFLTWLYEAGIRFGSIAHLGGDRLLMLDKTESPTALLIARPGGLPVDPNYALTGRYEVESDMLERLWERSVLPNGLTGTRTTFIAASKGDGFRANTGDTYKAWLATNPKPGRILIISISPHTFQLWEAVHALKEHAGDFSLYMAAPSAALGPQELSYLLGALARWLKSYCKAQGIKI